MGVNLSGAGIRWWAVLLVAVPLVTAQAQERLPDRRAVKAPVVNGPAGSAAEQALRQSLLDMQQQLEQFQTEQRQLRDTVEVQAHGLEQMKSSQRDLLADMDRRMRELERRGQADAAAVPASPVATMPAGPSAPPQAPPSAVQQQEYEAAFDLMKQGNYERAIKSFRTFVAKYPDSSLIANAQYWIAEGTYVLRNYRLALEEFTKVLTLYPHSPKAGDALLKVGYVQYELGAYDKARSAFNDVGARYPNTTASKLAAARLEKMKKEGK